MKKNYVCFVNDHSGSMDRLAQAALKDFNTNQMAVRDAATKERQDTIVSVLSLGMDAPGSNLSFAERGTSVYKEVVISNPHILEPKTSWPTTGGTPLFDAIADAIELHNGLPDINNPDVSVLIMVTTDGEEAHSHRHTASQVAQLVKDANATGRFTVTVRVPTNIRDSAMKGLTNLGIHFDNIQKWDTTAAGMAAATQVQTAAVDSFFRARASGAKATTSFYADSTQVNVSALNEIPAKDFSLYQVPVEDNGIEIRPFVLKHRMEHLYGAAFYQLTKSEANVQHDKQILVREPKTGKVYHGKEARAMIGLPEGRNARLHPSNLTKYEVFIQSNSINRKLVGGSGLIYWPKAPGARQFTDADTSYLKPKTVTATQSPVLQLPPVPVTNKPTKSPIPVTKKAPAGQYFKTREEARRFADSIGVAQKDIQDNGKLVLKERRWFVPGK